MVRMQLTYHIAARDITTSHARQFAYISSHE